ncbi:Alkaline phosphatase synthesis sensor protein PhoR [compost metagenome]
MKILALFLRKMNVLIFMSFLLFSMIFTILIVSIFNMNWNQIIAGFEGKELDKIVYLIMDDMRREEIDGRPLSDEQENWLRRRAALYGVMMRLESKDRKEVSLETFTNSGRRIEDGLSVEAVYVKDGLTAGYLKLSYMVQRNELDPSFQEFQHTIRLRTRILISIIMIVAIIFSLWVARWLSRHLNHVYLAAEEISAGKRNIRIPTKGPEEVRRLAMTLNEMTVELKRQEDWRHHLMEDFMHELRTPLTSVLSQVEAMIDGIYESDKDRLEELYEELFRLTRLVNDLERLSEAEAARFIMNVRRTDMVELARRVYNSFQALAREKGIRLSFEPVHVPCYAEVDQDKIMQVLTNLALNAIKYTSGGGTIIIKVDWVHNYTRITCEDTGIGISENDLPYIFNRMYRADKSRSRFSGGVGLGLSIAKALVEAHNGSIEAKSRVGYGSRFIITVPNVYRAFGTIE